MTTNATVNLSGALMALLPSEGWKSPRQHYCILFKVSRAGLSTFQSAGRVLYSPLKHPKKLLTCTWEYAVPPNKDLTNSGRDGHAVRGVQEPMMHKKPSDLCHPAHTSFATGADKYS